VNGSDVCCHPTTPLWPFMQTDNWKSKGKRSVTGFRSTVADWSCGFGGHELATVAAAGVNNCQPVHTRSKRLHVASIINHTAVFP
jgi:hypothetical protein